MKGKNKETLRVFGATGTRQILEFLDEHGTGQHIQMRELVNVGTLDYRLRELLCFGLISHHYERKPRKVEWYEITEKGRDALQHLRALTEIHKVIGATGTKLVLEFLNQHGKAQFIEMGKLMNTGTMNYRLRDLLSLGLISHHSERNPRKKEWYEITEKGRDALQHLRALIELT